MGTLFRGRRIARKTFAAVAIAIILLVGWALIGVSVHIGRTDQQQLAEAQAIWKAKGIQSYRMSGWIAVPLLYSSPFSVTVKQGRVTQASVPTSASVPGSAISMLGSFVPTVADEYTVDQLLAFAAGKVARQPALPIVSLCEGSDGADRYEVKVNAELGYLQSMTHTSCPRWQFGAGLICGGATADCASLFQVTSFEALPD